MASGYRLYVSELNQICSKSKLEDFPKILFVYGSVDFFVRSSIDTICKHWFNLCSGEVLKHGELDFSSDEWSNLLGQAGLFASRSMHVLTVSDLRKIPVLLKKISQSHEHAQFCIEIRRNDIGKIATNITPGISILKCQPPGGSEMRSFVQALSAKHKLKLGATAADLVIETIGEDFSMLANEIEKLGLIFCDHGNKEMHADEIASILGILREDHAFKISDFLLDGKHSEAELLVDGLLARGESALAILGIISRHIRMLIYHLPNPVESPRNNADAAARLPSWLKGKYESVARRYSIDRLIRIFDNLSETDHKLKSSKASDGILLQSLMREIRCQQGY